MLGNCQNFSTQVAMLEHVLGEKPAIVVTGIDANDVGYDLHLTGWNAWKLVIGDREVTGHASNVKALCRAALHHCPTPVVRLDFSVTAGGNTWSHHTSLDLSNPEAVAGGFAVLFRKVLNAKQRQSGSGCSSSEGCD